MTEKTLICGYDKSGQCIAVGGSVVELARMLDKKPSTIWSGLYHKSRLYARVEITEDDDDEL